MKNPCPLEMTSVQITDYRLTTMRYTGNFVFAFSLFYREIMLDVFIENLASCRQKTVESH